MWLEDFYFELFFLLKNDELFESSCWI